MRLVLGLALAQCQAHGIIPDSFRHSKRALCPPPHTSGNYICDAVGGRVRYSPGRLAHTLQASSVASSEHQF